MPTLYHLTSNDIEKFIELLHIFAAEFELENFELPETQHLQQLLAKPDFVVLVAMENNNVVGGLTVHILQQYYSSRPQAYIYDVAVTHTYQRKGVGQQLINWLINYCKKNKIEQAFVQADVNDTHALNFYRKTPITSELPAIQFEYLFT